MSSLPQAQADVCWGENFWCPARAGHVTGNFWCPARAGHVTGTKTGIFVEKIEVFFGMKTKRRLL